MCPPRWPRVGAVAALEKWRGPEGSCGQLVALRWLGLGVASFSPPPILPRFPSFSCLPGLPLLLYRGYNSWNCSEVDVSWRFASVSDSALGRVCAMWQILGGGRGGGKALSLPLSNW